MYKLNPSKIVTRNRDGSVREIFYHLKTGIQVAVVDWYPRRLVYKRITLYIPHQGKYGYKVIVNDWLSAGKIIRAQNNPVSKWLCKLVLTISGRRLRIT